MPGYPSLVTAEEFARIPDDDHRYELVEGRVVRMSPPGSRHAVIAARVTVVLTQHADRHRLGVVMAPGGFKLASHPDTVREPDVAFVRSERIPSSGIPDGFWPGPPDLAIEIRSPGDRLSEIQAKIDEYLNRGVGVVWVVDGRARTITAYRPNAPSTTHRGNDTLQADDVLPGLAATVNDVFV